MTMTETSEGGLHLPPITNGDCREGQSNGSAAQHNQVSYLTVPSHVRLKQQQAHEPTPRPDYDHNQHLYHRSMENLQIEPHSVTIPESARKLLPTFGVGKGRPRGFPSIASRTRFFGDPSKMRRHSLPRTESLGDCTTISTENAAQFNSEVFVIPTLYLPPEEGRDEERSDMVTIPSSYMLPSVQEHPSEAAFGSSDYGSSEGNFSGGRRGSVTRRPMNVDDDNKPSEDYLTVRRGSSVSQTYVIPFPLRLPPQAEDVKGEEDKEEEVEEEEGEEEEEKKDLAGEENEEINGKEEVQEEEDKKDDADNKELSQHEASDKQGAESRSNELESCPDKLSSSHEKDEWPNIDSISVEPRDEMDWSEPFDQNDHLLNIMRNTRKSIKKKNEKRKKRELKESDLEEDPLDPFAIIRASMNRVKKREAGWTPSMLAETKSVSTVVQPLTMISLQRSLMHNRPALMDPLIGKARGHEFRPAAPDQEICTGYLPIEKFTFVCTWLRAIESLRSEGELEGEPVSEAELMWQYSEDYTPSTGNHNDSI